jgi:hypothetical protein
MILSDEARFAYIHIPKCAGSTVRRWLRRHLEHDPRFNDYVEVPGAGRLQGSHLPLDVLRAHFPAEFEKLGRYHTATVVRDPLDRFASAFAQHQRLFHGRNTGLMSRAEIDREFAVLAGRLAAGEERRDPELMHFQAQHRFVRLDGRVVVREIYPFERVDALIASLAERLSIPRPRETQVNVRRRHRLPLAGGLLHSGKKAVQAVLPERAWRPLHDRALSLLTERAGDRPDFADGMRDFVREWYAQDFEIHRSAMADPHPGAVP